MEDPNRLVVDDLREQIKRLEARLTGIENHGRADFIHDATGDAEQEDSSVGEYKGDHDQQISSSKTIPKVRKCNFMEFKNRFTEEDGCYAIDVLESGVLLDQEIQQEQSLRERLSESSGRATSRAAKRKVDGLVKEANRTNESLRNAQSDDIWIRRIRLQSPALLRIFSKIQGETWSARPRVYYRPFCPLIYYYPQIKIALEELEKRWGSHLDSTPGETPAKSIGDDVEEGETGEEGEESLDDSPAALAIMRCFVEFLDKDVIPDSARFASLDYSNEAKIRFSDLCYLFRTGDIIYRPVEGEVPGYRDSRMGQRSWRVYHTDYSSGKIQSPIADHHDHIHQGPEVNDGGFTIQAYCIEHTGDELCVITNSFAISPYEGLKPVNSLPVFPLRFVADHKAFFQLAVETGDQVLHSIETKHATYNGWTVMRTTKGGFVTDVNGVILKHPEHVNSEVMVDYGEAFQACPSWRPERVVLKPETVNQIMVSDDFNIRWWSGPDRARLLRESSEITPHRTGIHTLERNKFVSEDPFLAADSENQQMGQHTTKKHLRREDKVLITCRVFAYVFRERKFAQLDVRRLKPSAQSWDALDSLKIPQAIKDLVKGSVRGHFIQKESEKRNGEEGLSLDVIQGKGTGLFILLHGVPGVGKTATAEAVAQANGKPLFKITVGDLGLTPDQVESSLRHIFRLASNWDCILLMDEVDTFFSQRSKGDAAMTKNALVSVFLRILDYYTGILFLTTNRAGALDEAFKSRIHYKLYFPPLSKQQTLDIWKLNIQRLRHLEEQCKERLPLEISESDILSFAETQFDNNRNRTGQWNGRQIRNAFQVARSLALFEVANDAPRSMGLSSNEPTPAGVLDIKHFHLMHEITESFDHYMEEVFSGMNDGDLALEMEHRADHWTSKRWARKSRAPEEYGDRYNSYDDRKSPFDIPSSRGFTGRPRSSSHKESRPSLSIPVSTQRYQSNSLLPHLATGYDEIVMDDPEADILPPISPKPGQRRQSKPLESYEGEYMVGRNSNDGPRFESGFDFRSLTRGNGGYLLGRDSRRQSNFEAEPNYRKERNEYGKRERE